MAKNVWQAVKSEEKAIVHVVTAALAAAEGVASFVFLLIVFVWQLFFLLGIGLALVLVRELFFYFIPVLIDFAVPIVDVINVAIEALNVFALAIVGGYDALASVVDMFPGANWPIIEPWWTSTISYNEYKDALKFIATQCKPYNALVPIYSRAVLPYISNYTCPYARLAIPAFGRDAVDVFTDTITVSPFPYENNCRATYPSTTTLAVCVPLASGYFIAEILFPLMIIGLFIWSCFGPFRHFAWAVIQLASLTLETTVRVLTQTVSETVAFMERKKNN